MWWNAKGAVHAELQLVSKSLSSSFSEKSPTQHQVDNNPVCQLTCEKEDGKAGSMYSSWAQGFYRPSHTLFLFFSHHQPPTNNTRKGSALCLDGRVSVLSVLIRCLIQQRAWQLTCLAEVSVIDEVRLVEVNSALMCHVVGDGFCPQQTVQGVFWQVTMWNEKPRYWGRYY